MSSVSKFAFLLLKSLHPPLSFSEANFPNIAKLVECLNEIGSKHNATAAQITLAWVLAQGNDVIPIPGTTKIEVMRPRSFVPIFDLTDHLFFKSLKENVAAANIQLTAEEIKKVRTLAEATHASQLARYLPGLMATLFVNTPEPDKSVL